MSKLIIDHETGLPLPKNVTPRHNLKVKHPTPEQGESNAENLVYAIIFFAIAGIAWVML